jgi:hypothetical protein
MRIVLGLILFIVGLAILLADFHVAYVKQDSAHTLNVIVGVLIVFGGGYVMMPTLADSFADSVLKRIPALASIWPGGMRKTDPPPQPNIPPPPSVTGEPPRDA